MGVFLFARYPVKKTAIGSVNRGPEDSTQGPSNLNQKSFLQMLPTLAINTLKMAPKTNERLHERPWDNPRRALRGTGGHFRRGRRRRRSEQVSPFTLHPTSYTLHPTPCTLHPTPYILHPTTYNLHPTPYTLHPTPFTLHPTPYILQPTPYTLHPTRHDVAINPRMDDRFRANSAHVRQSTPYSGLDLSHFW